MNFAIRKVLCARRVKVRHSWVEIQAHLCFSAAVDPMTNCAPLQEVLSALWQRFRISQKRVLFAAFFSGNRQISDRSGRQCLERRRRGGSSETSPYHQAHGENSSDRNHHKCQEN
jgi:hypothetical protein